MKFGFTIRSSQNAETGALSFVLYHQHKAFNCETVDAAIDKARDLVIARIPQPRWEVGIELDGQTSITNVLITATEVDAAGDALASAAQTYPNARVTAVRRLGDDERGDE